MDREKTSRRIAEIERKITDIENSLSGLESDRKALAFILRAMENGSGLSVQIPQSYDARFEIKERMARRNDPYGYKLSVFFLDAVKASLPVVKKEIRSRWAAISDLEQELEELEELNHMEP